MTLTREDKKDIVIALWMRKNYIQTGDISISAGDAERMGKGVLIKPLSTAQMKLIIRIEELVTEFSR